MSDSDNAQIPLLTPQEEKETPQETPEEEATVMPTTNALATRKPQEPKEPKNNNKEIVKSLEATKYFDDHKPLTPKPSLLDVNNESTLFNLSPGKSLMLNDADFNASSTKDYMDESFVDEMYYSSFVYIDSIKAKAIGGNAQLEYFVASS